MSLARSAGQALARGFHSSSEVLAGNLRPASISEAEVERALALIESLMQQNDLLMEENRQLRSRQQPSSELRPDWPDRTG